MLYSFIVTKAYFYFRSVGFVKRQIGEAVPSSAICGSTRKIGKQGCCYRRVERNSEALYGSAMPKSGFGAGKIVTNRKYSKLWISKEKAGLRRDAVQTTIAAKSTIKRPGQRCGHNLQHRGFVRMHLWRGVGTGGTVMSVGRKLRSQEPSVRVYPVEPAESPTLSTGHKIGKHRIPGISDEFIPRILD
jgi:hypothetical protein